MEMPCQSWMSNLQLFFFLKRKPSDIYFKYQGSVSCCYITSRTKARGLNNKSFIWLVILQIGNLGRGQESDSFGSVWLPRDSAVSCMLALRSCCCQRGAPWFSMGLILRLHVSLVSLQQAGLAWSHSKAEGQAPASSVK